MTQAQIATSARLAGVRYEIRGQLAHRAHELERVGYEIVKLNIGNPGNFGFRTPETMRLAMIENLKASEAYCHQKGIFPAREAVVMQQQSRGVLGVTAEDVFIGNGVSELIDLSQRALLNTGDEVLIPAPDYPLWTASVILNGGQPVHYPCRYENNYIPDADEIAELISPNTRAIVIINPNNPTGAVYPRADLEKLVAMAERHNLVVLADEIYDEMLYDDAEHVPLATLVSDTLCVSFAGLSKIYRACGYRVGWLSVSGARQRADAYVGAMELLASLRLCSNVPGQWAVQTALGGYQSVFELTSPGGRLYESRKAMLAGIASSRYLDIVPPGGAMYGFVRVDDDLLAGFDDHNFALELLEKKHVLIAPGTSFNVAEKNYFRITTLPERDVLADVFARIDALLDETQ